MVYPLYEVRDGKHVLSRKPKKPTPVSEYLKIQGRFRHLTDDYIKEIQNQVDIKYADLEWLASRDSN